MQALRSQGTVPLLAALAWAALSACGGGKSASLNSSAAGTILEHPASSPTRSLRFVVDSNHGGRASELHLTGLAWGRLVDVYDLDEQGRIRLQHEDYVIGADVTTNPIDLVLEISPVTLEESVIIQHTADEPNSRYDAIFAQLDRNLRPVDDVGFEHAGTFTMVPRNAVLVATFDDLIDPESVGADALRLWVGNPPTLPFIARVVPDYNHGDLTRVGSQTAFRSTRVILDPTVTQLESFQSDPPLPVNGVGFPPATTVNLTNLSLRLPTREQNSIGIERILRNLSGHSLALSQNGTIDFESPSVDVLRFMRSGGRSQVTGDPDNGFLQDRQAPTLVGRRAVQILDPPAPDPEGVDDTHRILPRLEFLSQRCARTPRLGDVLQQPGFVAEITDAGVAIQDHLYHDVRVRLRFGSPAEWENAGLGLGLLLSPYDVQLDQGSELCLVSVLPTPGGFPEQPGQKLATDSVFTLRFSEPMDPASVTAFDSLTLTRVPQQPTSEQFVVGTVGLSLDLSEFRFVPDLPLAHETGLTESYFLTLAEAPQGPTDLAGNALIETMPQLEFQLDAEAAEVRNGGRVSLFASADEDPPFGDQLGPLPEWNGQHLYDLTRGVIGPRPVLHYQATCDAQTPIVSLMVPFARGVQTPLSRLGSKMQSVWRYADVGFSLTTFENMNVDVEGLHWAPATGSALADHYPQFEIRMVHSARLPDELPGQGLLPLYPSSGLVPEFALNPLIGPRSEPRIVHPKQLGYTVNPDDSFSSDSGTQLMPWPMNRDLPVKDYRYFTWRDTAIYQRAAPQGRGVDLGILVDRIGVGTRDMMLVNRVTTIGLPLLTEFRCYPDDAALGLNPFSIFLASTTAPRPNFRAFSTGGRNQTGQIVRVDPDNEHVANGGFNPNSNPPGAKTGNRDNSVYAGAMDLVTRVSRSISIWFEAGSLPAPRYRPPVVEPLPQDQPSGTSVQLSFRGATAVEPAAARENALSLDLYGEHYEEPSISRSEPNLSMSLLHEGEWFDDISVIDGAPYYQVRVTFLSNSESGVTPELSALAVAWQE